MTAAIPPMSFRWMGDCMVPLRPRDADRFYVVGEVYRLVEHQDRSQASHNHYFACIAEAWNNLSDDWAARLPTPEHLRKHALIKAGYADKETFVASSKAEALRIAGFIRPPADHYVIITVDGPIVTRWTAHSQSQRAMGKKTFEESKQAVLRICAELIGTTQQALSAHAGQAA
jgi:hypothetical protein